VLNDDQGELVVIQRPLKATPADKYLLCTFCYGFYAKKSLARHIERCTFNKKKASGKAAAKLAGHCCIAILLQPLRTNRVGQSS